MQAGALEPRALVSALEQGRFYSSTGVELQTLEASCVRSCTSPSRQRPYSKYRIQFIGQGGRVLREVAEPDASYTFTGDERYVRAKVLESNGAVAWTQPVGVGTQAPK